MTNPGFLYSCITKQKYILTEAYATNTINFNSSINEIKKSSYPDSTGHQVYKKTINNIIFHVYVNKSYLFIVATEIENIDERAYEFLKCIQTRFSALKLDVNQSSSGPPMQATSSTNSIPLSKYCLNQSFKTELSSILNQYNTNKKIWATQQSMQSLNNIKNQVNEVTEIMRNNIDTVLDRGEALEDMICRADDLQATTNVFHQQTNQIHRTLYWRDVRLRIFLGVLVLVLIGLLIGWLVNKFRKDDAGEP